MLDTRFWKKYFEVYDVLNELKPYQDLLVSVRDSLEIKNRDFVFDAGAGTGNLAMLLSASGAKVLAFDGSKEGLDIYQKKDKTAIIEVGDILSPLPFPDNYFDKICSNNVLYTLPRSRRDAVGKEFYRVLKPAGIIVISNIREGFSPIRIYLEHLRWEFFTHGFIRAILRILKFVPPTIKILYYNSLIKNENESGSYDFFNPNEQKELLSRAGFQDVSIDRVVYGGQGVLTSGKKK